MLGVGWFLTRDPQTDVDVPTERLDLRVLAASALLGAVVILPYSAGISWFAAADQLFTNTVPPSGHGPVPQRLSGQWWRLVNPVFVVWAGLLISSCFVVLAMTRRNVATLRLIGLGLGLLSVGNILLDTTGVLLGATLGGFIAFGFLAVGELLVGPLLLSRIGGDLHWRATTPVISAWMTARIITASGRAWLRDEVGYAAETAVCGSLAGGAARRGALRRRGPAPTGVVFPRPARGGGEGGGGELSGRGLRGQPGDIGDVGDLTISRQTAIRTPLPDTAGLAEPRPPSGGTDRGHP